MGNIIKALELETGKTCFDTYRRCLDHERASLIEYDEFSHEFMKEQGETERFSGARNIQQIGMFGSALTMSTLFPDEPTVPARVEELVNKAVEEFDSCQKLAERLFPKVFNKEESSTSTSNE